MENAFGRLLKVLGLERKQGFRNKAVIGGLDKFASRWETEARAACDNQSLVSEIVALMIGYPSVEGQPARERIIEQIARRASEAERASIASDSRQPEGFAPTAPQAIVLSPLKRAISPSAQAANEIPADTSDVSGELVQPASKAGLVEPAMPAAPGSAMPVTGRPRFRLDRHSPDGMTRLATNLGLRFPNRR